MNSLRHVAIIMDGNRRWATLQNVSVQSGHKKGAEALMNFCKYFQHCNIPYLTVYAFSSENNHRSNEEKNNLFSILEDYLNNSIQKLQKEKIKVQFIGDFSIFSQQIQERIAKIHSSEIPDYRFILNIALNYGGKQEICHAFNRIKKETITEQDITMNLYQPNTPDVNLLIRTGGMQRLSNFLIWQTTYAELYFSKYLWPDFNEEEFQKALEFYKMQQRNFGS